MTPIFGEGGAERTAEELGVPFLGRIPILPILREIGDAGTPFEAWTASPQVKEVFQKVAEQVSKMVNLGSESARAVH
jgi:ATP-binding protein involved in chromosome partitioning